MSDESRCEKCKRVLKPGDWPWCHGDEKEHEAPHYAFTWGTGGPFTRK